MRNSRYLYLVTLLILFNSCDFAKQKVKKEINKIAEETNEFIDEWLTLPDRTVKRDILESEMYGDWVITKESLIKIDKLRTDFPDWECIRFPSLRFRLNNKTIDAWLTEKYVPAASHKYPVTVDDSTMITGQWSIGKDTYCNDTTTSHFKNKFNLRFDFESNQTFFVNLDIAEEEGELILWTYIGDPDQLYYQEYKQK